MEGVLEVLIQSIKQSVGEPLIKPSIKVVVPRRVSTEEEHCTQRKNRMVTKHSG